MLANFDAPGREESVAARIISNTPQQALTLLDDPTFVECSRVFAERLLEQKAESDAQRIDQAFLMAVARSPKPKETDALLHFLAEQRANYGAGPRTISAGHNAGRARTENTSAGGTPKLVLVKASSTTAAIPGVAGGKGGKGAASSDCDDANKLLSVGIAPAPKDISPNELAAWTQVCRVILNLHETITLY